MLTTMLKVKFCRRARASKKYDFQKKKKEAKHKHVYEQKPKFNKIKRVRIMTHVYKNRVFFSQYCFYLIYQSRYKQRRNDND